MPSISVIIPTLGKNEYLDYTLASLSGQTFRDFEVVVVNDGGDEKRTGDLVDAYRDRLTVNHLMRPHGGRSAARNHGLAVAGGDRIVFIDDDRITPPDFLSNHAAHGPDTLAIGWKRRAITVWKGGSVLNATPADLHTIQERFADRIDLDNPAEQRVVDPADLIDDFPGTAERIDLGDEKDNYRDVVHMFTPELRDFAVPWALVTTGNLSVDRAALTGIGGFDEGYLGWGIEDVDLGYRLHRHGLRTIVDTGAVNHHQMHPQGGSVVELSVRRRGAESLRNAQHFCHTHATLETYLYWQFITRKHSLLQLNRLVTEMSRIEPGIVRDEILRLYEATLPPSATKKAQPLNLYCAAAPVLAPG